MMEWLVREFPFLKPIKVELGVISGVRAGPCGSVYVLPNKDQEGFPTTYWQDRQISGTVSLWPVPDGTQTSLKFYQVCQIDDAEFANGQTVNIPYYFLEAFAYGLAQRLAMIWATDRVQILKPLADESYQIAAMQNVETAQQYISPMISGYFR
jgi:hypothetical protein